MKHIHIVNPYQSIAMYRMSSPLKMPEGLPAIYEVTESAEADPKADLNYCLPYHPAAKEGADFGNSKVVIVYTHCNPEDKGGLMYACNRADAIVAMSFTGRRELVGMGVDPAKITVIYSGSDGFAMRRRNIGIIGYVQPSGRKRAHLLVDLAWMLDDKTKKCLNFVIAGQNWEEIVKQMEENGLAVQFFDHLPDDKLQEFYSQMDAVLVTGHAEGGPLPLLEALSCGIPVFSPPIGYAADLLEPEWIYTSDVDLCAILAELIRPMESRKELAILFTWRNYIMDHAVLFGRLLRESMDVLPKEGQSRYAQLTDIIDEYRPRHICEIGTWTGTRAVQMIQAAAKYYAIERVQYTGFDLFDAMTGEQYLRERSKMAYRMSVVERRLKATRAQIKLIPGDTQDTLPRACPEADLYFIDGGHSVETIWNDWFFVSERMGDGVAVFDDYYHAGDHPGIGCNLIIDTIAESGEYEVTHLPARTVIEGGEIGMVKVRRKNAGVSLPLHKRALQHSTTNYAGAISYRVSTMSGACVANPAGGDGELERTPA